MANFVRHYVQDLQNKINLRIDGSLTFSGDNLSTQIEVEVLDGGAAATLSGTVVGYAIRADGGTVVMTGTLSGNTVSVILPEAALAYTGPLAVSLQLVSSGVKTTLLKVAYNVDEISTSTTIDPGDVVPDLADILAELDDMAAATAAAESAAAFLTLLAPNESTSTASRAYSVGEYLVYSEALYRVTSAIASGGTITPNTNCTAVTVGGELSDLKSDISGIETAAASDVGKALKAKTVSNGRVTEWEFGEIAVEELEKKVPFPTDSEEDIILPVSEKMLTVKPDGSTDYQDIPIGDVAKSLLLDSFSEDESKTKVTITINTSGTPASGEVEGLRKTMRVLKGDISITPAVGQVGITDQDSLWYVSFGVSVIVPVTPGHTYKFVARTPRAEDAWYPPTAAFFAPDFDFDFATAYVGIPKTAGSVSFSPSSHSTDGTGKIFNGSGVIVPEGMNYMLINVIRLTKDEGQEDDVRDFEVYDYTEYPIDATYDKIVDDPVIGDTYKVSYALTRATSSNNATTVNGSAQYKTVITAERGKIISACSVQVGNQVYTPADGVLTINGSASNIKITAAAESLPDDSYVGGYVIKRDLIPADLLASKLDTPTGLSSAEAGQMLYANGAGGLIIKDAPFVPNHRISMEWKDVYGQWAAGYFYDPSNDYAYTQIPSTDTIWGLELRIRVSCTPFASLIPVEQGERYRYKAPPVMLDRLNVYLPGVILFDSNKDVIEVISAEDTEFGSVYKEFTIPRGGAYMAVLYYNSQGYGLQKYEVRTLDQFDLLSAINANYRSYLLGTSPVKQPLDKAYFCVGSDDLRPHQTKAIHTLFSSNNIPYYMASIPENIKACVTDDPYKTNYDYMQLCVAAGGEIVCHSDDWIRSANIDDFNTLYKYFVANKRELESYGFDVHGIFKAGGDGGIHNADKRMDAWAAYFYDYSDVFGYTFPYRYMNRQFFEWIGTGNIDTAVENAINNNSYAVFGLHEVSSDASNMFDYFMTKLSGYMRGVDYDFITPYELYKKLMPEPTQD